MRCLGIIRIKVSLNNNFIRRRKEKLYATYKKDLNKTKN